MKRHPCRPDDVLAPSSQRGLLGSKSTRLCELARLDFRGGGPVRIGSMLAKALPSSVRMQAKGSIL
jgi:hypothetical protein